MSDPELNIDPQDAAVDPAAGMRWTLWRGAGAAATAIATPVIAQLYRFLKSILVGAQFDDNAMTATVTGGDAATSTLQTFLADNAGRRIVETDVARDSADGTFLLRLVTTDARPRIGFVVPNGRTLTAVYTSDGDDIMGEFLGVGQTYTQRADAAVPGITLLWVITGESQ